MKKVVITGVSTGIGYSSAKILCNAGYSVYGSVRKSEDAERIVHKLGENFHPLVFDITDSQRIFADEYPIPVLTPVITTFFIFCFPIFD